MISQTQMQSDLKGSPFHPVPLDLFVLFVGNILNGKGCIEFWIDRVTDAAIINYITIGFTAGIDEDFINAAAASGL